MSTSIEIEVGPLRALLRSVKNVAEDISPVLDKVGQATLDANLEHFDSQGSGKWTPLSQNTLANRKRLGYGSKPQLVRTGTLRASLTTKGARGNVFRNTGKELEVGTNLPYAAPLHAGSDDIPPRQLVSDPERLIVVVEEISTQHLEDAL